MAQACKATEIDGQMVCGHCGLQWPVDDVKPDCDPMTFERMRKALGAEISRCELSIAVVDGLKAKGEPADPAAERRRLAELNALYRMLERVIADKAVRDLLNGRG